MPDDAALTGPMMAEHICPVCGGPNGCGIAAGASTCWCFGASIPAAALEPIPEDARDRRCLCAACAGQTAAGAASPAEA